MGNKFETPDLTHHILRVAVFPYTLKRMCDLEAGAKARWGEHASMTSTISYQQSFPNAEKFIDTLLHEIGHAIWWAYGMEEDDNEERIVRAFATAWVQIYQDNPWLLELITKTLATRPA